MKVLNIFFSATGNTEKVARAIQAGVKQKAGHCDIIEIREANPRRLYEYDLIGLGSPILDFVVSGNVTAFINNMRFVGGKHIFVFNTHGTQFHDSAGADASDDKRVDLVPSKFSHWIAFPPVGMFRIGIFNRSGLLLFRVHDNKCRG